MSISELDRQFILEKDKEIEALVKKSNSYIENFKKSKGYILGLSANNDVIKVLQANSFDELVAREKEVTSKAKKNWLIIGVIGTIVLIGVGSNYILAIIVAFIGASFITLGRKKTSESNDSLFVFNQNQTELETYYREINYVFDTSLKIMDIIHPYLIESVGEKPIVTPEELQTGELDFVPIKYINGFLDLNANEGIFEKVSLKDVENPSKPKNIYKRTNVNIPMKTTHISLD